MKMLYQTQVTVHGGREGHAESHDGNLKVDLTTPKELGGPAKVGATNPEQLFAAGYAACFESALRFVARAQKISVDNASVTATIGLAKNSAGEGFVLGAALKVSLPDLAADVAQKLVAQAHQVCPYSNATRGNLDVQIEIVGE